MSAQNRPDREDVTVGSTVRRLRKAAGLTQVELAHLVDVGPRLVGELERGKPSIRMDLANRVLASFGKQLGVVERPREEL